jgi:hypothetical protein
MFRYRGVAQVAEAQGPEFKIPVLKKNELIKTIK